MAPLKVMQKVEARVQAMVESKEQASGSKRVAKMVDMLAMMLV